jgi:peptide/nickel transport system ATP-binding protein
MVDQNNTLLEVDNLKTYFFLQEGTVRAVDGVSFGIRRGEVLGIIGESGCGKSVTAQSVLRIVPSPPGEIVDGHIMYHRHLHGGGIVDSVDLAALEPHGGEIRRIRGGEISMIFQEPMTSFGPMHTVGNQIMEAILLHGKEMKRPEARQRAIELLDKVGIPRPDQTIDSYPHQLSGGMRQRAMIAMALSCNPSLLIADEPTTALDVTIQAQILDLLRGLQQDFGMAIMYITHNLGVIAELADDVAVMYLGKIVEQASLVEVFDHPRHPYTRALMRSIPRIDDVTKTRLYVIEGSVPDPYDIPPGCPFSDRCPEFMPGKCDAAVPALIEADGGHFIRCYLYSDAKEGMNGAGKEGE